MVPRSSSVVPFWVWYLLCGYDVRLQLHDQGPDRALARIRLCGIIELQSTEAVREESFVNRAPWRVLNQMLIPYC